mmetsp:Transcript_67000/g.158011  ORF Transcript_67000/g.158011 Transcript_67000/m.158011 type:complete len:349 (+) Transcript_67000:48-1094(+)
MVARLLALLLLALACWLQGCQDDSTGGAETVGGQRRLGSFLVIGDWGWDAKSHGNLQSRYCQQLVADAMHEQMELMDDVKFIINVGDSFYPDGVHNRSDPQWDEKWRQVYSSTVRNVPWYSVYGNHDYQGDPCACSEDLSSCAQINDNIIDMNYFFMPDMSFFKEHPELDTEVIAMDINYLMWVNQTCPNTGCPELCSQNMKARAFAAFELFNQRVAKSSASNWLVFTHYPTDYFPGAWNTTEPLQWWTPSWVRMTESEWPSGFSQFLNELSNPSRPSITYFAGHRHNVDQSTVASTAPHTNWLSGGGAGWSTDGDQQGFVVGEIMEGGEVRTNAVIVNFTECMRDSS